MELKSHQHFDSAGVFLSPDAFASVRQTGRQSGDGTRARAGHAAECLRPIDGRRRMPYLLNSSAELDVRTGEGGT